MKKISDPNSTTINIRLSVQAKAALKRLAERDDRPVGNYLERLLERVDQPQTYTLADVMDQLEVIKTMMKAKAKTATPRKEKWEKLYNMPLDTEDGEELMARESWIAWIDHLNKMGCKPNEYSLELHLKMFEEHYNDDWNIDYVVADLIKRGSRSIYIHSDLRKA